MLTGFALGMYCQNGTRPDGDDPDTNDAVGPLWEVSSLVMLEYVQSLKVLQLNGTDWWMHHVNKVT